MTIRIEIEGDEALQAAFRDMSDDIRDMVEFAVLDAAAEMETRVKLKMQQGPHTGRPYKRGNVVHIASAPGQTPAPDIGTLMGSVYHEREGSLAAVAGARTAYAAYLEYGTTRMAPRPVWVPTAEEVGREFREDLTKILTSALQ